MNILENTCKNILDLKRQLNEQIQSNLQVGLKYICDTYPDKIGSITILGWTPGFNDGEPCEHTTEYFINFNELNDHEIENLVENMLDSELYGTHSESGYKSKTFGCKFILFECSLSRHRQKIRHKLCSSICF
jgi:hypothetical protein